ncbi:type II toxin-antitoxin system ParD family antitoxin [Asticcacaulis endophyticus]|uniref:Antitoxin protein parD-4 n=1 Tax=Asticcacaulis endophyticus TaxID=1395890 RepID=A0A918PZT6_9CAUL|nr:type II toxin-antitoxin system ParD family antitoxin [Asticcacaulis endophyticus]GGZ28759.1 antitoxin protein parD-4 [Asticcacaulis endophyticus]
MAKISISMTDGMNDYVQARVKAGEYNNTSEYFRDLVRRDQENAAKYMALKQAIQDGLDSGISDKSIDDAWAEADREYDAQNG